MPAMRWMALRHGSARQQGIHVGRVCLRALWGDSGPIDPAEPRKERAGSARSQGDATPRAPSQARRHTTSRSAFERRQSGPQCRLEEEIQTVSEFSDQSAIAAPQSFPMSGGICRNYAFVQPEDYLSIYVRFSPKRNCSRCETSTSIPSSWEQRNTWTVAIPGSEQATRWDSFTARSTEDMKRRARGSPCLRGETTQGRPCVAAPASALLLAAWAQHGVVPAGGWIHTF